MKRTIKTDAVADLIRRLHNGEKIAPLQICWILDVLVNERDALLNGTNNDEELKVLQEALMVAETAIDKQMEFINRWESNFRKLLNERT